MEIILEEQIIHKYIAFEKYLRDKISSKKRDLIIKEYEREEIMKIMENEILQDKRENINHRLARIRENFRESKNIEKEIDKYKEDISIFKGISGVIEVAKRLKNKNMSIEFVEGVTSIEKDDLIELFKLP